MAQITIPSIDQETAEIGLVRDSNVLPTMAGRDVITVFPRAVWRYSFQLITLDASEMAAWSAALIQLTNLANHFKAGPPGYTGAVYVGAVPVVNGGGQTGTTLITDGAANGTMILRAGEYFEVNGELKMVTANITTNGAGQSTITFEPPLKAPPPDNTALVLLNPKAMFRLEDPQYVMQIRPPVLGRLAIKAIEAVYA